MFVEFLRSHPRFSATAAWLGRAAFALALTISATAQQAAPLPQGQSTAATSAFSRQGAGSISEEELRQMLVGKALYLRGGYLDNTLGFDEHGRISGHSPQGSYTLSAIEIDKVRLTKHKLTLEGARYGLHFVGQLAYEDPAKALDRVRITPKKKMVRIIIDREMVVMPKKKKAVKAAKEKKADAAVAETAAAPAPLPESQKVVTPEQTAETLREALDQIFAPGLDERMMAAMPDFWKLYYQAVAERVDYRPRDPAILRQKNVDQKAVLLTQFEPDSNELAQACGVAGMALYHTVIGPDGKAGEIAVGRPIGFGLDENAVEAIRKASFQPAIKDGKPVPVLLDLVVQFRIFDRRTGVHAAPDPAVKAAELALPGPYGLPQP